MSDADLIQHSALYTASTREEDCAKNDIPSSQTQHHERWILEWCVFDLTGSKCSGHLMYRPAINSLPAARHHCPPADSSFGDDSWYAVGHSTHS